MTIQTNIIRISLIFTVLFSFISCGKDTNNVPAAYVNFQIDLTLPDYFDLNTPGQHAMVVGGVRGILIYRVDTDNFKAYDRTCTYDTHTDGCRISHKEGNFNFVCNCCNSEFEPTFGAAQKGPAQHPLREYKTTYSGGDILIVHN